MPPTHAPLAPVPGEGEGEGVKAGAAETQQQQEQQEQQQQREEDSKVEEGEARGDAGGGEEDARGGKAEAEAEAELEDWELPGPKPQPRAGPGAGPERAAEATLPKTTKAPTGEPPRERRKGTCAHNTTAAVQAAKCVKKMSKAPMGTTTSAFLCLRCGDMHMDDKSAVRHAEKQTQHPLAVQLSTLAVQCLRCDTEIEEKQWVEDAARVVGLLTEKLHKVESRRHSRRRKDSDSEEEGEGEAKAGDDGAALAIHGGAAAAGAPRGLRNLGNTCYFNATLQCLSRCASLRRALRHAEDNGPVTAELGKLLGEVCAGPAPTPASGGKKGTSYVTPHALFQHVCHERFGYDQQDADEFLTLLFFELEREARGGESEAVRRRVNVDKVVSMAAEADEDTDAGGSSAPTTPSTATTTSTSATSASDANATAKTKTKSKNPVVSAFGFDLRSTVVCDDCRTKTATTEHAHTSLKLALPSSVALAAAAAAAASTSAKQHRKELAAASASGSASSSSRAELTDLLARFTSSERIKDFQCETCAKRGGFEDIRKAPTHEATKSVALASAPDTLIVQLMRFENAVVGVGKRGAPKVGLRKVHDQVELPLTLDMSRWVAASVRGEVDCTSYELVGFVSHLGNTISAGHYVAYVRGAGSSSSEWFYVSDDQVTRVAASKVASAQPYIGFYALSSSSSSSS